ncbi:hypothetical protein BDN72DRAFT_847155 [Pluteus cervinus]|uniref:Uncharacterized protein n=1 Tax=Pluteus cervinus TaxID=181527 RepID=A0ACD3AE18_9AGAR|nr:hypothetical protein BDN72DRAFT_847155 [Pluteus cervinus]
MFDVPVELWLNILSYMSVSDIRPLSESCKVLRDITIPFLFKTIITRPFYKGNPNIIQQGLIRLGITSLGLSARLPRNCSQLLGIPRISQAIETLAILPHGITLGDYRASTRKQFSIVDLHIDEILELLPNLPNLKHLICAYVPLPKRDINRIVQLPLKRLELHRCTPIAEKPVTAQGSGTLESVKIDFDPEPTFSFAERTYLFLALFSEAPNLKYIHSTAVVDVPYTITKSRPPSLTTLNLPVCVTWESAGCFATALGACPWLKTLILRCPPGQDIYLPMDALQPNSLPKLEHYAGPAAYMDLTSNRPSVKDVHLFHTEFVAIPGHSIHLIPQTLRSFKCTSHTIGPFFFPSVHSHFSSHPWSALESLTILYQDFSKEYHGLSRLLDDTSLVPLPSIRQFSFYASLGPRKCLEATLNGCLPNLLRIYPNLEEATFIHSADCKTELGLVWVRSREGDNSEEVTGSLEFVEVNEEQLWLSL